jgi:polar amino acid transport system ATP-binding protein
MCIIGPSGSGKSTVLHCMNHLEEMDGGRVELDGELIGYRMRGHKYVTLPENVLAQQRTKMGMVFQSFNLFPHMTVLQNIIESPCGVLNQNSKEAKATAMALLEKVAWPTRPTDTPASCPVASSNAWPSPAPWR